MELEKRAELLNCEATEEAVVAAIEALTRAKDEGVQKVEEGLRGRLRRAGGMW